MIRFLFLAGALALVNAGLDSCDVGEPVIGGGGLCDSASTTTEDKCHKFCSDHFKTELFTATCSDIRANDKRECICKLKCACGGSWGDPHYTSFDQSPFDYQGTAEHCLIKPITKYASLPQFHVTQSNKPWGSGPVSVIKTLTLNVLDWKQVVVMSALEDFGTPTLTVNGQVTTVPFRYSQIVQGYKEQYISCDYADTSKKTLLLETSFGLRLLLNSYWLGRVCIPRHPDLKGKSHGLLGRWNDDPSDDCVDPNGVKQVPGSWAFGDSWLVSAGGKKSKQEQDKCDKEFKGQLAKCKQEKPLTRRIEQLCGTMQKPAMIDCAKRLGHPVQSAKDCFVDLCHLKNEKERKAFICGMVKEYNKQCKTNEVCGSGQDKSSGGDD